MIEPSVGRHVWYWPLATEKSYSHDQPLNAVIAHVHANDRITVVVTSDKGWPQPPKQEVTLAQDREALPGECSWMPFQLGQAKSPG